jgi:hypothetical protein
MTPVPDRRLWCQIPVCAGCGQQEDPFPSVAEAKRVLESYGWRRVPEPTAWDGDHWATGSPRAWYCPPCRSRWDSDRMRLQRPHRQMVHAYLHGAP